MRADTLCFRFALLFFCHPERSAAKWRDLLLSSRAERSGVEGPAVLPPTLIVYGDRDPLYPMEMAVDMYRAIPRSALWIVPYGGHGPIFFDTAPQFTQTALSFFRSWGGTPRA